MERVGTLINKLQEQFNQQADADKLAITAQLLLAELQMLKPITTSQAKVAVVMPQVAVSLPLEMRAVVQHTPKHTNKKETASCPVRTSCPPFPSAEGKRSAYP